MLNNWLFSFENALIYKKQRLIIIKIRLIFFEQQWLELFFEQQLPAIEQQLSAIRSQASGE